MTSKISWSEHFLHEFITGSKYGLSVPHESHENVSSFQKGLPGGHNEWVSVLVTVSHFFVRVLK